MTCRLLVSQKAFPQRDVLSCAQDRTGQEAPPVDSCALILLEPRLLRPKYMQRGDSAPPKTCTRMYTLETRGPFLRSYSLEKLENARKTGFRFSEFGENKKGPRVA